jgi:hypothetical protein
MMYVALWHCSCSFLYSFYTQLLNETTFERRKNFVRFRTGCFKNVRNPPTAFSERNGKLVAELSL